MPADPLGRVLRIIGVALLVIIAAPLLVVEAVHAKGLTGHCGIHWGALYRIDSGGARYHARIGPKTGVVGGTMHCYGKMLIRRTNAATGGFVDTWTPYNWLQWHWKGILATNGTASSCVGFGLALAGEAPSGAVDTWLTASAGLACVGGVSYIEQTYLSASGDPDYCGRFACNGPGRVRFK
jgi:hypothetical protein